MREPRVLLLGNPNVGKSALFTRLTGVRAMSSNYPGTTVGFLEGRMKVGENIYRLIDVPGAYTLDPTNEAEEVARRIVDEEGDRAIVVVDATALERNLFLTLQVLERGIPTVVALNMVDEARHRGIGLNVESLSKLLGVPVIPTIGTTGEGINDLVKSLPEAKSTAVPHLDDNGRWVRIGEIVKSVQTVTHRHHSLSDRLEDVSADPVWGALMGIAVLVLSFWFVRLAGEGLINHVMNPIFEKLWMPVLQRIAAWLQGYPQLSEVMIGTVLNGAINPETSFGLLSTGLYVPLVMVFPYVFSFYGVLSFLEDLGYLPRLAVLFDALMHRLGLHGYAIVPALLGFGCNVPGVLATRVLESSRERFIASTLISISVPCAGLQAMILGVIGPLGGWALTLVYGSLMASWIIIGRILHMTLPGYSPELIAEIPPYRLPPIGSLVLKVLYRIRGFFAEAIPLVMVGVLLVNLLYSTKAMSVISDVTAPIFKGLLGLPPQTAVPIVMGMLRKDIAMGMLLPMGLTPDQLIVATVTLAMTFPCIATFVVLWRELGFRKLLLSVAIMITSALATGTLLRIALSIVK